MTYELVFLETAKKEWDNLTPTIQKQFKNKLVERIIFPKVPKDKLSGIKDCYKIKLKAIGYRLIYKVIEVRFVIQIIAIGRRDKDTVYKLARIRT